MSRILLLNPPGKRVYIRDYYCSKISKSNYLFHPIDLLMLSGILSGPHEVSVVDAIADRLDENDCLANIEQLRPDVVVSLIGAVSLDEDLPFLKRVAGRVSRVFVSGDACRETPVAWLSAHAWIEAVITDFTSADILNYLAGLPSAPGVIGQSITAETPSPPAPREFSLLPRHDLFKSRNYRFPFVRHHDFATVLTDYGCPFPCSFCIMSTLPYRYRPIENVLAELRLIKQSGKRELFISDQAFGVRRESALELCRHMTSDKFGFGWVCFSRVDLVDAELISAMKAAGCHTIIFGVESASEEILRTYRKGYTTRQIREAFRLAHGAGIRTVATFILGLPEETESTAYETREFLKALDCDFASFNVAVPRAGTTLRQDALKAGLIRPDVTSMDQSGTTIAMPSLHLSRSRIQELRAQAVRDFYLRPSYLWKRLVGIRTLYEFKEQVYAALVLFREVLRRGEER